MLLLYVADARCSSRGPWQHFHMYMLKQYYGFIAFNRMRVSTFGAKMTSPTSKDPDEPPELVVSRIELILFIMRDGGLSLRQAERLFEDISSAVKTTRRHMVYVRCDTKVIPLNASSEPGSIHRELEEHFSWYFGRSVRLRQRSLTAVE